MKLCNIDTDISSIDKFILEFKKNICSNVKLNKKQEYNINVEIILNNKSIFNESKCFAKTGSGKQCKQTGGYCSSIFCGLHYSGKGAHIRKRNNTTNRFYLYDNQTSLKYDFSFKLSKKEKFKENDLRIIYINSEKYYIYLWDYCIYRYDEELNIYEKVDKYN